MGPGSTATIDAFEDAAWLETFEIATMSAVCKVRAALPLLRKAECARIVIVSAHSTRRQTPSLIAST